LRVFVFIAAVLAVYALWYSALHWTLCGAASLLLCYWLAGCRNPREIRRLQCEAGRWRLVLDGAATVEAEPLRDSVLLPRLVILRIRPAGTMPVATLVLGADAYPEECWRRLQLNLRQSLSAASG
jgi:hypothetical protein